MSKKELDNLVRINRLKAEPGSRREFAGMLNSARTRLADAQNESLDPDSQFDLAYGAAHRLALAALRHQGRNLAEYEGRTEIDEGLLADLIRCTKEIGNRVSKARSPCRRMKGLPVRSSVKCRPESRGPVPKGTMRSPVR